jgi:hypothetical protein
VLEGAAGGVVAALVSVEPALDPVLFWTGVGRADEEVVACSR